MALLIKRISVLLMVIFVYSGAVNGAFVDKLLFHNEILVWKWTSKG